MNSDENAVVEHYSRGKLLQRILAGLKASGADLTRLQVGDLMPVDEFHIGGRAATEYAVGRMGLGPNDSVLDIGCGIGGAARFIASSIGCRVTGIDLTPEYIEVAKDLSRRVRLHERLSFETASATDMPFASATFDAAITLHVAMNITDRASLYAETARVIRPGGSLCVYDVMKMNEEGLDYPVPWAQTVETSHLTTPQQTRDLLSDAGFEVREVDDRRDFSLKFFEQINADPTAGPPPLGTHLLLGSGARQMFENIQANIQSGRVAPVQMLATRRRSA